MSYTIERKLGTKPIEYVDTLKGKYNEVLNKVSILLNDTPGPCVYRIRKGRETKAILKKGK
jgi:hypothetical protein